jgi:hypothetical protein
MAAPTPYLRKEPVEYNTRAVGGMVDSTDGTAPDNSHVTMYTEAGFPTTGTDQLVCTGLKDFLVLFPFGDNALGESFDLYVWWLHALSSGYVRNFALKITCALGAVGVASTAIDADHRPVELFTAPDANSQTNFRAVNGLHDGAGRIVLGTDGAIAALVHGDIGSAASWNCEYMTYGGT